ncbi:hypothetical protein [Catenulispora rubra]|uniref:hypothetical protein n=1 Tax=Catenulispora rubra TaxID=280293 RepID=UPI0018924AF3|nr:hypothetical protein [Catenulispora rubra]
MTDLMGGRVLDSSALAQAAAGSLYMRALFETARQRMIQLLVPATALSDAIAETESPAGRELLQLVARFPMVTVKALDESDALASGLLRAERLPTASTSAGHVAFYAAERGWPVVTSLPDALRALFPGVEIESLP